MPHTLNNSVDSQDRGIIYFKGSKAEDQHQKYLMKLELGI